jgi:hypothetical protein
MKPFERHSCDVDIAHKGACSASLQTVNSSSETVLMVEDDDVVVKLYDKQ